jgi:hypothetical protein
MKAFYKLAILPVAIEACVVYYAVRAATTIPEGGDPTLRQLSIGIPGFWAVIIPLILLALFLSYNGQQIVISPRSFSIKRGTNVKSLPWQEISYRPSVVHKMDRQFSLTTQNGSITVRSLFYPDFDAIEDEVRSRMKARERREITI